MDIGNPIIYTCPSCGKKMEMTTFTSYTVSSSKSFSDGEITKSGICCPDFTPDLAKCPKCKNLFFRHDDKTAKSVNFYENKVKAEIEDPNRKDLIKAVKNKTFKKWSDEKILREMLWRELNRDTRMGEYQFKGRELKDWQDNCAALLKLTEKALKNNHEDRDTCILMIAELNRNLGNFAKCMELINSFSGKWSWIKKQYAWECKGKNIFTFELMSKKEMNLEKEKKQYAVYYYNRAKNFLPPFYGRRNIKKALADYNKAESMGMKDSDFYITRSLLYLEELKDTEKALADIKTALNKDKNNYDLYAGRSLIYEAMGDIKAAQKDKLKVETLLKKEQEKEEAENKKRMVAMLRKRKRKGKTISEL